MKSPCLCGAECLVAAGHLEYMAVRDTWGSTRGMEKLWGAPNHAFRSQHKFPRSRKRQAEVPKICRDWLLVQKGSLNGTENVWGGAGEHIMWASHAVLRHWAWSYSAIEVFKHGRDMIRNRSTERIYLHYQSLSERFAAPKYGFYVCFNLAWESGSDVSTYLHPNVNLKLLCTE